MSRKTPRVAQARATPAARYEYNNYWFFTVSSRKNRPSGFW
ncbi:hypothetical protein GGD56_001243 [Rhizobium mongolense]|uniref:Uncharacterized protein n=2 Tax=Rhizobium mongolense TaxID=57676 RepID=A0ABR6IHS5_9HYPH|nr:hypothetical protein [Rhizobium mongolense]TVZ74572.1 hypothetical protein BCL32_2969 [Rhizobium mongolense USDA 1844]